VKFDFQMKRKVKKRNLKKVKRLIKLIFIIISGIFN